ncbi:MAG: flagellar FliJ family protein [Clostridiales bacterium]|nr:flagellar FliJ family protein [Clostridiales bacterium]MCF8021718.1 flagellar FliJ family protein [Clostridiales bacterium]
MSSFKFRLETVLQYRETSEKKAIAAQARAEKEYVNKLEQLEQVKHKLESSMQQDTNSWFDAVNNLMYQELLSARVAEYKNEVNDALHKFEQCRQKTIKVRRQKMILQNLKQNQYNNYTYEKNKAEQNEIDDIAVRMRSWNQTHHTRG